MGRALFAAGVRKGTLVLNCFAYDLSPLGHMLESGARAIGKPGRARRRRRSRAQGRRDAAAAAALLQR